MDLVKIYSKEDFANAVIPEGQALVFTALDESGNPVTMYKDEKGKFGIIAGGGNSEVTEKENPLTLTAYIAGSTVKLRKNGSPVISGLKYRLSDKSEWLPYTIETEITLTNVNDYVQFMNEEEELSSYEDFVFFKLSGGINASGNCMSLLNYSNSCKPYCFNYLFGRTASAALKTPPELPATELAVGCYYGLFDRSGIETAPELPATVLYDSCYKYMFSGCASLTSAPLLPAKELAPSCYFHMFGGCTALSYVPTLSAHTSVGDSALEKMFKDCTSLTKISCVIGGSNVQLGKRCCYTMFSGCSNLEDISELILPSMYLNTSCYAYMFQNCSNLTTAPKLPATTLADSCYSSMFNGCSSLVESPILVAPNSCFECYKKMFYNCSSLKKIEVAFTEWKEYTKDGETTLFTVDWVVGVNPNGEFIAPASLPAQYGTSLMPEGWEYAYNEIKIIYGYFVNNGDSIVFQQVSGGNPVGDPVAVDAINIVNTGVDQPEYNSNKSTE